MGWLCCYIASLQGKEPVKPLVIIRFSLLILQLSLGTSNGSMWHHLTKGAFQQILLGLLTVAEFVFSVVCYGTVRGAEAHMPCTVMNTETCDRRQQFNMAATIQRILQLCAKLHCVYIIHLRIPSNH